VKHIGRYVAAGGVAAVLAGAGQGVANAAEARQGARDEPAVAAGGRTMGAAELARAGRAVESTPAVTIYQARLPDGTLELSDRPPAGAAGAVERRSYGLAPQDPAARQRAEAEREYWRRQADAFVKRQQDREREAERARRERPPPTIVVAEVPRRAVYHGYGWLPPEIAAPGFVSGGFGAVGGYTSSPGAVQGRSSGFIGSGFATAR
jgi:hypothetical protein